MRKSIKSFISNNLGQDLVEYALLLTFLALAAIGILPTLANSINNVFSRSASTLSGS
jgi:Flp pilus assembly pilin Flp